MNGQFQLLQLGHRVINASQIIAINLAQPRETATTQQRRGPGRQSQRRSVGTTDGVRIWLQTSGNPYTAAQSPFQYIQNETLSTNVLPAFIDVFGTEAQAVRRLVSELARTGQILVLSQYSGAGQQSQEAERMPNAVAETAAAPVRRRGRRRATANKTQTAAA